ncbi:hypothetical protein MBORA_15780 [Methanobrevibacter oralis]|uniref:IrrE N-terminal-like domain-containing protein n=1 Tax=Methanobrevibacter oralis TaxID=66851 RepID=A0A165ZYJ8_METOA|nr:ImmA/IrrE family metallo-endopeptidase [Methanobrevibacter oralis]KZX11333.1 hypothetical protein MBORA_15780 [Methanobrevibacter oralis]
MIARAKINPKMMEWARLHAGFTNGYEEVLPLEIKNRYEKWENGDVSPTWKQLRTASKKFNLPTAFFFMKNPPMFDDSPNLINYRKLDIDSIYQSNSPALIENIHKSETRRLIFMELSEELGEDISSFNVPVLAHNKKAFSEYIREILDVSIETQKSWMKEKKHYSFLNNWKEIITNKLGILIFETEGVEIEEMRGLCILHDKIPIILLNGKDEPNGRIFTLFHELTHLLLGESAICGDDMNKSIEIFCNSVAGEFLVPEHDLLENINNSDLSDESLKGLYNTYGVSEYVILRRLFDLNKITKTEYDSKIDHYINFNTNTDDESKGFYLYNMVKYNGRPFYSLVLEAYDYGIISSLEFSKYTNLGQKQIPKLQEILFGGEQ